jgi:hypothetical protein
VKPSGKNTPLIVFISLVFMCVHPDLYPLKQNRVDDDQKHNQHWIVYAQQVPSTESSHGGTAFIQDHRRTFTVPATTPASMVNAMARGKGTFKMICGCLRVQP